MVKCTNFLIKVGNAFYGVWNPLKYGFMKLVLSNEVYKKWLLDGMEITDDTAVIIKLCGKVDYISKYYRIELEDTAFVKAYVATSRGEATDEDWAIFNKYFALGTSASVSDVCRLMFEDGDLTQGKISFFGKCPEIGDNEKDH
tara:strand:- start:69449 stop:69877 length:429 start_codon:yes stop_codon:yes gene_type:complete